MHTCDIVRMTIRTLFVSVYYELAISDLCVSDATKITDYQ